LKSYDIINKFRRFFVASIFQIKRRDRNGIAKIRYDIIGKIHRNIQKPVSLPVNSTNNSQKIRQQEKEKIPFYFLNNKNILNYLKIYGIKKNCSRMRERKTS
jgi:hypothetical protein